MLLRRRRSWTKRGRLAGGLVKTISPMKTCSSKKNEAISGVVATPSCNVSDNP